MKREPEEFEHFKGPDCVYRRQMQQVAIMQEEISRQREQQLHNELIGTIKTHSVFEPSTPVLNREYTALFIPAISPRSAEISERRQRRKHIIDEKESRRSNSKIM